MSVRILTGMCILFRYLVDILLCLSLVLASKTITGNMRSISCMHSAWGQLVVPQWLYTRSSTPFVILDLFLHLNGDDPLPLGGASHFSNVLITMTSKSPKIGLV